MIDEDGFRSNVGIVIANGRGQVMWFRRLGQDAWQFPQGGIRKNESPEQAMYRELDEEVGLKSGDVKILASTKGWLRYRLPKRMLRHDSKPLCIGQKQKWFLLQLKQDPDHVGFEHHEKPEFDHWQWVSYWYPIDKVVSFKKEVYRRALKELVREHNRVVESYA